MNNDFWAARISFRPPIPEIEAAADLLSQAADSLLASDEASARSLIEQANMPELRSYTRSIASQVTREIHRLRDVSGLARLVPRAERGPRQPPAGLAMELFQRDGFRCRYCGCRIVLPHAERVMAALVPNAVRWGTTDADLNAAFFTLRGVLDHVEPHAHGGQSVPDNLVVACQPCNYGKGPGFIQQFGISDPRLRPPRTDAWDGLYRVLALRGAKPTRTAQTLPVAHAARSTARPVNALLARRKASVEDFTSRFSVADRRQLDALLQVLASCSSFGVDWKIGRVLLVNIVVNDVSLSAFGIESDATVQIPWWIGPHKRAFRSFAETLAAGLPNATVYETEKMWRVRCFGRVPTLAELMENPASISDAFQALHNAMIS